ncbi:MAG TPA: tRNA 2-thiocytidine(32) synthetase TtcA [Candidatus Scatomorpha merdigallinarum]|nr:tRNA 2-thiocytidine(32) synthetase TtcA [Candidatus Scatomorpha merdigallinarum]
MDLNRFTGFVRRCADDYGMLQPGDRVAVGVSGGKDSMALLASLAHLRRYHPSHFELEAITIAMGFPDMDFTPVAEWCAAHELPYTIINSDIREIVFDVRQEENPCSLCSKLRRGALNDAIKARGCNKLALGHHFDDAVETFLMNLLFTGQLSCFKPSTYMSRADVTQIRPMLYIGEGTIASFVCEMGLPIVSTTCPEDKQSKREEIKSLIKRLSAEYPDLKDKVFGAMQRLPLDGWGKV